MSSEGTNDGYAWRWQRGMRSGGTSSHQPNPPPNPLPFNLKSRRLIKCAAACHGEMGRWRSRGNIGGHGKNKGWWDGGAEEK
ncbi:hypothetical protein AB6A40_004757 [Gnathostoma spinigerum]|uniref:Uncharacterized protein n=1 Tax=Gnathostoma spinigerum TaxID=75299 RepID=A0ABD6EDK6_9BILA